MIWKYFLDNPEYISTKIWISSSKNFPLHSFSKICMLRWNSHPFSLTEIIFSAFLSVICLIGCLCIEKKSLYAGVCPLTKRTQHRSLSVTLVTTPCQRKANDARLLFQHLNSMLAALFHSLWIVKSSLGISSFFIIVVNHCVSWSACL